MTDKKNRFDILDSLRGIAAIAVMLYHYLSGYHNEFGFEKRPLLDFRYGFFGVQLFFIISGFVIYFSITNSKSIGDFMVKRLIRLYPTFWLCVLITFIVINHFGLSVTRDPSRSDALINLTMLPGLFHAKFVDSSYWSLQIELFFYFFMASLFIFKLQRYLKFILFGWLACIFFYNFVHKVPGAGLFLNLQYGMFFIAGIVFYKIKVLKENTFVNHFIIVVSYIAGIAVLKNMEGYLWGITGVYIIFYLAVYEKLSFLNNKPLLFIGKISYALYLIHDYIGLIILQQLKSFGYSDPLLVIIPVMVSVLLAWIITNYFDAYISKWLRRKLTNHKPVLT